MPEEIDVIDPLGRSGWDDLVLSSPNYSFFHSADWARVLHEAYGYKPVYISIGRSGKIAAVIPCMEVKSILTGTRAVSLPFSDYCEPIVLDGDAGREAIEDLIGRLFDYGKQAAWRSIDLRWDTVALQQAPPSFTCYGHTIDLTDTESQAFSKLRDSTRRNIKKAIGEGVKVEVFDSMSALREFYRLNCLTRKAHGLPPQPFRFFEKVYEHVVAKGKGIVVLASHQGANVAGAVYVHLGQKAIYKYGASDRGFQHLRANNLVMWEAIRWYSGRGFRSLCLGRTERTNPGLLQFKRGWNAQERAIRYYRYDVRRESFVTEAAASRSNGGNSLFRRMPIPLLRMTGSVLYRHIG